MNKISKIASYILCICLIGIIIFAIRIHKNNVVYEAKDINDSQLITNFIKVPSKCNDDLIVITVSINGVPIDFTLDTGCSDMVLSSDAFKKLTKYGVISENDSIKNIKCYSYDGSIDIRKSYNIKNISINDYNIGSCTCIVLDNNEGETNLIGVNVLKRIGKIMIDYSNNNVYIEINKNNNI